MDDQQRNLLLAVLVSIAILIGWTLFYDAPRQQALRDQQAAEQAQLEAQQQQAGTISQPNNGSSNSSNIPAAGVSAGASGSAATPTASSAMATREEALALSPGRVTIETEATSASINLQGGRFDDLVLKHYRETIEEDSPLISMFRPLGGKDPYFADYGWIASDGNTKVPGVDETWSILTQSDSAVTLGWDNGEGAVFETTYDFSKGRYLVEVTQTMRNNGTAAASIQPFGRILRYGTPETTGFFILHEGLIGYFENENLEEINYGKLDNGQPINYTSKGGWLGFTDKYWLASIMPQQDRTSDISFSRAESSIGEVFETEFNQQPVSVAAGQSYSYTSHAFVGAKEVSLLDEYSETYNIPKFDKAVDFGWFYFLTKPFFLALSYINGLIGNFGVAILILTVGVKLLLFPLANAGYRSMSKMKLLAPKLKDLRERHGDDRQALNKDMMALYKEEKVNPLGGCFPILIQIPVFFALYKVLFVTIEMRHTPFFGWIKDLSAKDPTSILNLFGLLPFDPSKIAILGIISIGLWPIIMGLTMWLQQKLNPAPPDPMQARIMMFLPIIFTFILATFPAGLVIYWTWNNLLSIGQQWLIQRNTTLDKVKV